MVFTPVPNIIRLPESTTDRWPPGSIGTGSILVGLDQVEQMLVSKICKTGYKVGADLTTGIQLIRTQMGQPEIPHDTILKVKDAMGSIISVGHGYYHRATTWG